MKGIIALDIDGTLTGPDHEVPPEVIEYLEFLHEQQWQFIFITGRPYSWGVASLDVIKFPHFLAVYNGAYLLSRPDGLIAERHLLDRVVLESVNNICERFTTGCVVLGGIEHNEKIYYTPAKFDDATNAFFEKRMGVTKEEWIPVASSLDVPFDRFTSFKFFVNESIAEAIASVIEDELNLHVPIINDPVDSSYSILQATHPRANKGDALEDFSSICGWAGVRIAAGNDINDFPMFQKAQLTVAMQDSPLQLRQLATVIAPPIEKLGLIEGLKTVIAKYEKNR